MISYTLNPMAGMTGQRLQRLPKGTSMVALLAGPQVTDEQAPNQRHRLGWVQGGRTHTTKINKNI
jgi:hypothetical protein